MLFVFLASLSSLLGRPIILLCCVFFVFSVALTRSFFSASSSLEFRAYSDLDWADDSTNRRSTTDFCVFLGDSLISWKSKKQEVALSTTEAEYIAMSVTAREVVWLRQLLPDLGVVVTGSTPLYGDNRSAILIAGCRTDLGRIEHSNPLGLD